MRSVARYPQHLLFDMGGVIESPRGVARHMLLLFLGHPISWVLEKGTENILIFNFYFFFKKRGNILSVVDKMIYFTEG